MGDSVQSESGAGMGQEEHTVEIHKPKPIHSWRDFGKELGTIVLGIIIAISLEHLVESWSWQQEVKDARQSIRGEIAANNENLLAFRVAASPCVERQLREADAVLTARESGNKTAGLTFFNAPPAVVARDGEWQSERASQVLTHFPRAELSLMTRYYAQLFDLRGLTEMDGGGWRGLSLLWHPKGKFGDSDLVRLRGNLHDAEAANRLILNFSARALRLSDQLNVRHAVIAPERLKAFCTMNAEDFIQYRRAQDAR